MNVTMDHKLRVLGRIYAELFATLADGAEDGEVTADDVIDFFGLGIAAIIDNDSNLKTLRDLRLGAGTAGKLIERRAKEFRAMQDEAGISWLAVKLAQREAPDQATAIN